MDNELYWLWLTLKLGQSRKITQILEYFKNAENIYSSEETELRSVCGSGLAKLLSDKRLDEARRMYDAALKAGAYIITYDSEEYPPLLRSIYDPPYVLYARGNLYDWNSFIGIGVVGTRKCTSYGYEVTKRICEELAKNNVMIISGLAKGIDSVAAREALKADKPTIAVIGNGIDSVYPACNKDLFDAIEEYGMILSEYPPGFGVKNWTFPQRNRIISGLSRGVLVTQAPKKSGALITAKLAIEEGRDVFAVPASILSESCGGSNRLIADGAVPVLSADDILKEYPEYEHTKLRIIRKYENRNAKVLTALRDEAVDMPGITPEQQRICECIARGFQHVDEISRELTVPAGTLNSELLMLEISGILEGLPGNKYKLKLRKGVND